MAYRLGEFECLQCGHSEPAVSAAAKRGEPPADYGGVKRARLIVPPPSYAPPASQSRFDASSLPSTHGMTWTEYQSDVPEAAVSDPLRTEKLAYIGLQTLLVILSGVSALSPSTGDAPAAISPGVEMLLTMVLTLALNWLVLFGTTIWLKWACAGCVSLQVLGGVIGLLIIMPLLTGAIGVGGAGNPALVGFAASLIIGIYAAALAINVWFVSILWRDIQRLQGY